MTIALAQIPHPDSFETGLETVLKEIAEAAEAGARLICFPQSCVKGVRGVGFPVSPLTREQHNTAVDAVCRQAQKIGIHVILPIERPWRSGWQNGAYVLSAEGALLGYQSANQLTTEEELLYSPGSTRRLFFLEDLIFGITIGDEAWRYPETTRWAAIRGAHLVFHPHFSGSPGKPHQDDHRWGEPIFEKFMVCRAFENTIYFASVNYALPIQESATSVVAADGQCLNFAKRHERSLVLCEIDPQKATASNAKRWAPDRYVEE